MVGSTGTGNSTQILTMRTTIQGNTISGTRAYQGLHSAGTEGTDIHVTSDGGFIVLGNRDVYRSVGSSIPGDIMVIKASPNGTISWMNSYGTFQYREQGYAIQETSDGGYIIAGMMDMKPQTKPNALLMKLRKDGSLEWRKEYADATCGLTAHAVQEADGGGYIIAGMTYTPGTHDKNAFMMKVGRDGTFSWYQDFGDDGLWEIFYSVSKGYRGGFIASGSKGSDMYVVRVNDDGSLAWSKTYTGPGGSTDIAYDIKRSLNSYMIGGQLDGLKACLLRLNEEGNVEWAKTYAPPGATTSAMSVVFSEMGYTLGGETSSNGGDFYLVKTDGAGNAGCNTEAVSMQTTSLGGGANAYLGTLASGNFEISGDIAHSSISITEQQICFSQEEHIYDGAVLPDRVYRHDSDQGPILAWEEGNPQDYAIAPFMFPDHIWRSEAIWVRPMRDNIIGERSVGAFYENEFHHEGPDFSEGTNYIYVPVENHGSTASAAADLELYWSLASTNLKWPSNWIDYSTEDGIMKGDRIASVSIPSIPPGGLYVAEIPWNTPDPADYDDRTPAVSFLARFLSPEDPMTVEETDNTALNAINNNNIIWRNEIVVTAGDMSPDDPQAKTVFLRSGINGDEATMLTFSVPQDEQGLNPVITGGKVIVDLGQELYDRWEAADFPGENIEPHEGTEVIITGENASIHGLDIAEGEEFPVSIRFECTDSPLPYPQYYHYDVMQNGGIGGVTFELRFPADEYQWLEKPATKDRTAHTRMRLNAHPNPATGTTVISYALSQPTRGSLAIYDITGQLVRTLISEREMTAGIHTMQWDGTDVAGVPVNNGVYIYRLVTPAETMDRQIIMVR